jgi:hypothetical protein
LVLAGPGSDLSEELVRGCEPVALESESFPRCPPGPVLVRVARASLSIVWNTMSESRRLTQRVRSNLAVLRQGLTLLSRLDQIASGRPCGRVRDHP